MSGGSVTERKQAQKLAEELSRSPDVHFNKTEIEALLRGFKKELLESEKSTGHKLSRAKFRQFLYRKFNMTNDVLMDRIFRVFDRDSDSCISMKEWIKGLSIFLRGTQEEQMKFCFDVYDLNNDGYISKDEMFQFLKDTLMMKGGSEEDPDEGVRELVDLVLKKLDINRHGKISKEDYQDAVAGNPEKDIEGDHLLLESLGEVLPSEKLIREFEANFIQAA